MSDLKNEMPFVWKGIDTYIEIGTHEWPLPIDTEQVYQSFKGRLLEEKIDKLERALRASIAWSAQIHGEEGVKQLLDLIDAEDKQ